MTYAIANYLAVAALFASASWAGTEKVLQAFGLGNYSGGNDLYAGLVMDPSGNLYGAAESGGAFGAGLVFRLSPNRNGGWTETVLYNFRGGSVDGATPHSALFRDSAGNLYGTTVAGGVHNSACGGDCGIAFKLSLGGGIWHEAVLHKFTGGLDGGVPYASVVVDLAGNVYGATTGGGAAKHGTVYRLSPNGTGGWQETVLHSFTGKPDGAAPYATPILDSAGNVYGTTYTGGSANLGTVYKVSQTGSTWTEQVLYSFKGGSDGAHAFAGVILDANGNLYGTTVEGGSSSVGTAYKLSPNQAGGWSETLLYTFRGLFAQDPANPNGLVFDSSGNLYGSSQGGGQDNPGTIFKLTPNGNGAWTETVLYSFTGGNDGAYPSSGLVIDAAGNLFGTTLWGGPAGDTTGGVVFEYLP